MALEVSRPCWRSNLDLQDRAFAGDDIAGSIVKEHVRTLDDDAQTAEDRQEIAHVAGVDGVLQPAARHEGRMFAAATQRRLRGR